MVKIQGNTLTATLQLPPLISLNFHRQKGKTEAQLMQPAVCMGSMISTLTDLTFQTVFHTLLRMAIYHYTPMPSPACLITCPVWCNPQPQPTDVRVEAACWDTRPLSLDMPLIWTCLDFTGSPLTLKLPRNIRERPVRVMSNEHGSNFYSLRPAFTLQGLFRYLRCLIQYSRGCSLIHGVVE